MSEAPAKVTPEEIARWRNHRLRFWKLWRRLNNLTAADIALSRAEYERLTQLLKQHEEV